MKKSISGNKIGKLAGLTFGAMFIGLAFLTDLPDMAATWLSSLIVPPSIGEYPNTGYRVYSIGRHSLTLDVPAIQSVAIDTLGQIFRGLVFFLGVLLLVHALTWDLIRKKSAKPYIKSIDYIWYIGAVITLVLGAFDYLLRASESTVLAEEANYYNNKQTSILITHRLKAYCNNGEGNTVRDEYKEQICIFPTDVQSFWEDDTPLVEFGITSTREVHQDSIIIAKEGGYNTNSGLDPIRAQKNPSRLPTCEKLESLKYNFLPKSKQNVENQVEPYMVQLSQEEREALRGEAPFVVTIFDLCSRIQSGRLTAEGLAQNLIIALQVSHLRPIRGLWIFVLTGVIAIRLLKTTTEVREARDELISVGESNDAAIQKAVSAATRAQDAADKAFSSAESAESAASNLEEILKDVKRMKARIEEMFKSQKRDDPNMKK